jgi:hypothetical protein
MPPKISSNIKKSQSDNLVKLKTLSRKVEKTPLVEGSRKARTKGGGTRGYGRCRRVRTMFRGILSCEELRKARAIVPQL